MRTILFGGAKTIILVPLKKAFKLGIVTQSKYTKTSEKLMINDLKNKRRNNDRENVFFAIDNSGI